MEGVRGMLAVQRDRGVPEFLMGYGKNHFITLFLKLGCEGRSFFLSDRGEQIFSKH